MSVLEVFQQNADADPEGRARPHRPVPGRPRRARRARRARPDARRRPRDRRPRTSGCSRPGCRRRRRPSGLPIGVCLRIDPGRARLVARERAAARRGRLRRALVPGTTSSAAATGPCRSSRAGRSCRWRRRRRSSVTVGPFVLNVMNRHPARRRADGLDPPDRERRPARSSASASAARRRSTRRTASTSRRRRSASPGSRRRSRSSGRCGPAARSPATRRTTRCEDAVRLSRCPIPPPPIIVGGETPAGARLAGRIGDGWTAFDDNFEANLPLYLEALEATGRRREDQRVFVGFQGDWLGDEPTRRDARGSATRARPGSAGARPAPTGRSSSPGRPPTSTRSSRRVERW